MWLSRPDWKTLLLVPHHPLRQFAYQLYFQDIFLHFDVYRRDPIKDDLYLEDLERWHSRRSLWMMAQMLKDTQFANCVRTLKIRMCDLTLGGPTGVLGFETGTFGLRLGCS